MQRLAPTWIDRPLALTPVQRALLATDGTLTTLIEAYTGDTIEVRKLRERACPARAFEAALDLDGAAEALERTVLLCGREFIGPVVHAVSVIALGRLERRVHDLLLATDTPIGKALTACRVETFRELLGIATEPAGVNGAPLGIQSSAPVLVRRSRVIARGRPLMEITERIPYETFLERPPSLTRAP